MSVIIIMIMIAKLTARQLKMNTVLLSPKKNSAAKILQGYGVQRLASVADWRGDFARFELAFPRSDLGL